jgi:hypothetical protein
VARNESWEHLVLHMQSSSAKTSSTLVFSDFRMFGRVLFHIGDELPPWWTSIAPAITSDRFTIECVAEFMKRRGGITVKAALLMQERFPGIGNWMADEILWRACIHPSRRCGDLTDDEVAVLHSVCVWVCKQAMAIIGDSFADPPSTWLYHYRWQDGGKCPLTGTALQRETIGGRTSCFCPARQKMKGGGQNHVFMDEAPSGSTVLVKSSAWKAKASSSLAKETLHKTTPSLSKHGKKRGRAVSADVKVKEEDAEEAESVSPWGRQVRAAHARAARSAVKVEVAVETKERALKKIKAEDRVETAEVKSVLNITRRRPQEKLVAEPSASPSRLQRQPRVKTEGAAMTERQQMIRAIQESQQKQKHSRKQPR